MGRLSQPEFSCRTFSRNYAHFPPDMISWQLPGVCSRQCIMRLCMLTVSEKQEYLLLRCHLPW